MFLNQDGAPWQVWEIGRICSDEHDKTALFCYNGWWEVKLNEYENEYERRVNTW